jgi:hypothetical protein
MKRRIRQRISMKGGKRLLAEQILEFDDAGASKIQIARMLMEEEIKFVKKFIEVETDEIS